MNEILTPINFDGDLDQDDREILQKDRAALSMLVTSILANKRLAAAIVHGWLKENNYLLIPKKE